MVVLCFLFGFCSDFGNDEKLDAWMSFLKRMLCEAVCNFFTQKTRKFEKNEKSAAAGLVQAVYRGGLG